MNLFFKQRSCQKPARLEIFERYWQSGYSSNHKPERTTKNLNHWIGRGHVTSAQSISRKIDFSDLKERLHRDKPQTVTELKEVIGKGISNIYSEVNKNRHRHYEEKDNIPLPRSTGEYYSITNHLIRRTLFSV